MFNIIRKIQEKYEQRKGYANGVILGRERGRTVIDDTKGSVLIISEVKSGVVTNSIIPTLLNWKGNVIVLDFREEFYNLTLGYRKEIGQEIIKMTDESSCKDIKNIFDKKNYSLYLCISSLENENFKAKIKFLINEILRNRSKISEDTLFILPYFNVLGEVPILKDNIYLDSNMKDNLKLFLVSDMNSLLKNNYEMAILFGNISKILLYPSEYEKCKKFKFLQYLIEEMKPKKQEILYFNKFRNMKLKKIEYYKELYFIEKIKL